MSRLLALALTTSALAACADGAGDEDAEATLRGVVRDAATGRGIAAARVKFTSDTLDTASGATEDDGDFTLFVVSLSPHGRVEVRKDGYTPRTVSVFFDERRLELDISLKRQGDD